MSREETPPSLYSLCTIPLAAPCHFSESGAPILPYFSLISAEEPFHRSAPFPTLLRTNAPTPAQLPAIFPIAMRPSSPVFPLFLLRNRPTPVYLCADFSAPPRHFIYSGAPIPPYFSLISAEEPPHRSAPPRHFIYSGAPILPHFSVTPQQQRAHCSAPLSTNLGTNGSTSAHLRSRFYDGNGTFLPYEQIVDPKSFDRLYGGVGEKSIEYPRKVYRVFPESL